MSSFRYPTVFISHGTPMLAFGDDPFHENLARFSASIPKPKAIAIVSAHSVSSEDVHVLRTDKNWIQYDFSGFPKELYQIKYECAGDPKLADEIVRLLQDAQFSVKVDTDAPLDHGIWVPLLSLYPKGDVPVVRISLPINLIPIQLLKLGHTLSKLRENGVMLIGTGGAVHNLSELKWSQKHGPGHDWAKEFEQYVLLAVQNKDVDALVAIDENPEFFKAHPSAEHYLPILFAVGAALPGDEMRVIFKGVEYGSLSMLCFELNRKGEIEKAHSLH